MSWFFFKVVRYFTLSQTELILEEFTLAKGKFGFDSLIFRCILESYLKLFFGLVFHGNEYGKHIAEGRDGGSSLIVLISVVIAAVLIFPLVTTCRACDSSRYEHSMFLLTDGFKAVSADDRMNKRMIYLTYPMNFMLRRIIMVALFHISQPY